MKVIDLWECSACGAFYADKITACDCYMNGCTTLNHYHATLTSADNSPVIPDAYVLDELGRMTLNGVCEPRVSFGAGWNACRAEMLKAQQNEPQNIPTQPVSNPYKFLDERAKYRVIIEGFSNSRSVDFEACSQEEAEEIGRDIFHEECNYGVERLESIPAQEQK